VTTNLLEKLEQEFRDYLGTEALFYERGKTLQAIKARKLFKELFGTWRGYCSDRLDYDVRTADREIAAQKIVDLLRPIGLNLPSNEAQARPLTRRKLTNEDRLYCWRLAIETTDENLTAAHIERVVKAFLSDRNGTDETVGNRATEPEERQSMFNQALNKIIDGIDQLNSALVIPKFDDVAINNRDEYKSWLFDQLSADNVNKTKFQIIHLNQVKSLTTGDNPHLFYGYQMDDKGEIATPELRLGFVLQWQDTDDTETLQDQLVLNAPYPQYAI